MQLSPNYVKRKKPKTKKHLHLNMICVCRQRQTDTQTHRHRGVGKESQLLAEASSGVDSQPPREHVFLLLFSLYFLHFEHDFLSKKYTPVLVHNITF